MHIQEQSLHRQANHGIAQSNLIRCYISDLRHFQIAFAPLYRVMEQGQEGSSPARASDSQAKSNFHAAIDINILSPSYPPLDFALGTPRGTLRFEGLNVLLLGDTEKLKGDKLEIKAYEQQSDSGRGEGYADILIFKGYKHTIYSTVYVKWATDEKLRQEVKAEAFMYMKELRGLQGEVVPNFYGYFEQQHEAHEADYLGISVFEDTARPVDPQLNSEKFL